MEYTFKTDLYGNPLARLSMDHEAFGLWLTEELSGADQGASALRASILDKAQTIQNQQLFDAQFQGAGFTLNLDRMSAAVYDHNTGFDQEESHNYGDDLSECNSESQSECGLDDFIELFTAWQAFLLTCHRT